MAVMLIQVYFMSYNIHCVVDLFVYGIRVGCSHAVVGKKKTTIGDVTSLNVTLLRSGVRANNADVVNVIPPTAEVGFDIRISPNMEMSFIKDKLDMWCEEVTRTTPGLNKRENHGLTWEYSQAPLHNHCVTSTDPVVNKWYVFCMCMGDECVCVCMCDTDIWLFDMCSHICGL